MQILIGSNGGLTGIYLARNLRKIEKKLTIIGSDCEINSPGKFFVDQQIWLESATHANFITRLIEQINLKKIDFYFPTHSLEIIAVSQSAELIREKTKCKFMVSPYATFEALNNKKKATNNLSILGIPVPKIIDKNENECKYPILMKKNIGSGSQGIFLIDNPKIHRSFKENFENSCFYEYIVGNEYTCDCLFDENGNLVGYNQRIREKTLGGAVLITATDNSFDILPWIQKISNKWKMSGCINFQYIIKDNIPYFIDINLRFPSGGLPLTCESGLDIPKQMLQMMNDEFNWNNEIFVPVVNKRMYRYFEEIFEEF